MNSDAALNHEADVLGEDIPEPEHVIAARKVLEHPKSTRRERELAWRILKPLKVNPAKQYPDEPRFHRFFERMKTTNKFSRAASTSKQRKILLIAYLTGWDDAMKQEQSQPVSVMSEEESPREDFSETDRPS